MLDYSIRAYSVVQERPRAQMDKSIHSREYRAFLKLLRGTRIQAKVTQTELAARIDEAQTFVSKCERGERRIDIIELRSICSALGTSLQKVTRQLEKALEVDRSSKARRPPRR